MGYYFNTCKKTLTAEEFFSSMNKYHKALCPEHQHSLNIRGTTKGLQDLVRERHTDELIQEIPVLKTVKDWIADDVETWETVLKNKDDGRYHVTVSRGRGETQKKKKEEWSYFTPSTNGPRTKPLTVVLAATPSSQVADTVIVVLPNPRTREGFTMRSPPLSIPGMVPVVVFPARIRPPSRVIDQLMCVRSMRPLLVRVAFRPNPPATAIPMAGASLMMISWVAVSLSALLTSCDVNLIR